MNDKSFIELYNNYKEIPRWMKEQGKSAEEELYDYYVNNSRANQKELDNRKRKNKMELDTKNETVNIIKAEVKENIKDALIETLTKGNSKIKVKK